MIAAAPGFVIIQILAVGLHITHSEIAMIWPINLILLALSVLVVWGRWIRARLRRASLVRGSKPRHCFRSAIEIMIPRC